MKHLDGQVVSCPNSGSWDLGFEFCWMQNSACDCTVLHCREPFIIVHPSSQDDLNNVERDIKHQSSSLGRLCFMIVTFPK